MITLLLHLLRVLPFLVGGHRQLALENLALRQQLAVYRRTVARPRLRRMDRLFWVGLAKVWTAWRSHLLIVTPDTVLRWQRRRFREYWTQLSATNGRSSRRSLARSSRFPKWAACITATSGKRPDLASPGQSASPARHAPAPAGRPPSLPEPTSFPWAGWQACWLEKADCPTLGSLKTTSYRSSDESALTESDAVVARDRGDGPRGRPDGE
jgi:hypothetical protein